MKKATGKKKFIMEILIGMILAFILTACGNKVVDEEQIQIDLETSTEKSILADNEKILAVTIDKRQTQKDDKKDVVWCTIQTEDERCAYEKSIVLTYSLYDEGGWMLDEISGNDRSGWVITPLTGVNDDEISASLSGINITTNNEIWYVTQDNMKSILVDSHETNLEEQKDTVAVTLIVDDLIEEADGQLIINYSFEHGSWKMDSISGNENFSAATKAGMELNITEDILLKAIDGQSYKYNAQEPSMYSKQEITINKDEVVDFAIDRQESSSKGTSQQIFCNCTLAKPNAVFTLAIEVSYLYSDTWIIQPISVTSECTSVDITGKWTGTNAYGRICELDITEMDAEGNISGTYSDQGSAYNKAYSYYVAGKINRDTLEITLDAGDMIGEKPYKWFKPDNITAKVNIDDDLISGNADLLFNLTRS
ncbi:MAG: hypothetical protein HDR20_10125 [Lachnospiraceae bacterium]|nr:hypothetical protein [Lachnospiraceae bacterium]